MAESDDFGQGDRRFRRDSADPLPIGEIGDDRIERTRSWTLDHSADYLSIFAYAAYSQFGLITPVSEADITAAFQDVDWYDAETVTPRGIATNLANGTFAFALEGVYALSFVLSVDHDEVNNGREFQVRLFDQTLGAPVGSLASIVGTARNQGVTTFSATILVEVTPANAGDIFVMQIGGASGTPAGTYIDVEYNTTTLALWNVGEFRGVLSVVNSGVKLLRDL